MKIPTLPSLSRLEEVLSNQAPTILTSVGAVGTVTTAVMTAQAASKATRLLDMREQVTKEQLDVRGKIEATWKFYVPPVLMGALTVSAIVGANRIGVRRAAGLAAAYSLTEKAYSDYKETVVKTLGEDKERKIRDQVARDQVIRDRAGVDIVVMGTEVLCHEAFTGRTFTSNMEALKKAQNDLNYRVLNEGSASVSEFYDLVGLPHTEFSDEIGWTYENILELEFSTVLSEDGRPCLSFSFHTQPVRNYYKLG